MPLQEALDLPLSALKAQQEVAKLLPMALYTLWMQVSAYGEACDSFIKCVIRGDAEAALKLRKQEQEETMLKASAEEAEASQGETGGGGESDGEMEDTSGDRRKDRASAAASKAAPAAPSTAAAAQNSCSSDADAVMQLFALHPLSVELTVAAKGEAPRNVSFSCSENCTNVAELLKNLMMEILHNFFKDYSFHYNIVIFILFTLELWRDLLFLILAISCNRVFLII